ncbi:unnamed protein product [Phytomonas sp. EM1]|nr:unnamed protein product [Phytomonas sp. EM1]|eukprot:CCW63213.1 unnamed protein product [Phytomonas sp. isolate EM1]
MSLSSFCSLPDRRKMYYWAGTFICIVGFLLFILLIHEYIFGDTRFIPSFVGGYCALFATFMSFFLILEHLTCFSDPECQPKVVRILFMVPLYALISWASLLAPGAAKYLNLIRDAYESYAIYAFFQLMIAQMGGIDTLYRALMIEERPPIPQVFPFCNLEPIKVTPTFVQNCRLCLFQFMIIKPLVTIIVAVLTAKNKMGNLTDVTKGYFWTSLVYNVSISIAFMALLYFYKGLKEFMEGKNILMKFLCIKSVVFLSFWQGMLFAILAATNLLPTFSYWTREETPIALQDLLICVEMMFVSFTHRYCFGSDEYMVNSPVNSGIEEELLYDGMQFRATPAIRQSVRENLKYTLKQKDIWSDMKDIVRNR